MLLLCVVLQGERHLGKRHPGGGFAEIAMGDHEADCGLEVEGAIDGHEADAIGVVEAEDAMDGLYTEGWENPAERPRPQT